MDLFTNIILYFLAFVILLSIIVFVHEFGHYIIAILNKVRVEQFSIGFGKEIYGWKDKRGTRWKICYLPFGGYVKMLGEDIFKSQKLSKDDLKYAFSEKNLFQRFIIVLAGPMANFVFGILGFAIIYTTIGINFVPPIINKVQENSPAQIYGLQSGDKIISINNKKINNFYDIGMMINLYKNSNLDFKILRNEKFLLKEIKPIFVIEEMYGEKRNIAKIGITSFEPETKKYNFFYSLYLGTKSTYQICSLTIEALNQLIRGKGSLDDLGGPVKIAHFSGKMLEQGFLSFINLIILLSISIGLINLFPIPMLDGGHLVMYIFEGILGKPLNKEIQKTLFKIGFILIITLAVFLTYNDLIGLFDI